MFANGGRWHAAPHKHLTCARDIIPFVNKSCDLRLLLTSLTDEFKTSFFYNIVKCELNKSVVKCSEKYRLRQSCRQVRFKCKNYLAF